MSGPDCPECGEHCVDCSCNKKKKRLSRKERTEILLNITYPPKKPLVQPRHISNDISSFQDNYGSLRDIPNETLYKFLEENETRDAEFLAIVCSEILRRGLNRESK